ncbi:MAG: type I DNA topoisomerase, partial [bacterium]|nr:type I DNA topoisomerase [bacterium]
MKLIIVESPTKSVTIGKFLGKGYVVRSSFGHIRDLPKGKLGVDVEHDFSPEYVIPTKARKTVTALKKEAKKAEAVILATDEDREGEAIAFHLKEILSLKNPQRIVFHEITKKAIEEALQHPRSIDDNLVQAQQARRILDRLVGYKLSPFLWKKVAKRLSAGRVQSVAVRLVAQREKEIKAFIPQEYWNIVATLFTEKKEEFQAELSKKDGVAIEKLSIKNKQESDKILKELEGASYEVVAVERKETKRNPLPPFTTSTLQQASWQRFHYSARFTMQLAQHLYETGLITYHRTDSMNLSAEALLGAKEFIEGSYGTQYWAGERRYKTKSKGAQEAHEAIRPASPGKTSDSLKGLKPQELRLYDLIWRRFTASQMVPALIDANSIDVQANAYTFRANGQILRFDGFLKVYSLKFDEALLPILKEQDPLSLKQLTPEQHFTLPPPRYNEASLVKALESHGVGRPSTYAPILSLIQARNYVAKDEQKRFVLTELGEAVDNILVEHFPVIVDVEFTAGMENDLDEVAEGKKEWVPML